MLAVTLPEAGVVQDKVRRAGNEPHRRAEQDQPQPYCRVGNDDTILVQFIEAQFIEQWRLYLWHRFCLLLYTVAGAIEPVSVVVYCSMQAEVRNSWFKQLWLNAKQPADPDHDEHRQAGVLRPGGEADQQASTERQPAVARAAGHHLIGQQGGDAGQRPHHHINFDIVGVFAVERADRKQQGGDQPDAQAEQATRQPVHHHHPDRTQKRLRRAAPDIQVRGEGVDVAAVGQIRGGHARVGQPLPQQPDVGQRVLPVDKQAGVFKEVGVEAAALDHADGGVHYHRFVGVDDVW